MPSRQVNGGVAGFSGAVAFYGLPYMNGFRLGVADVVPAWDAEDERPTGLDEIPLVWMDRALSKYRGIEDPGAWVDDALALADVARSLEGLWVGLWHPNLTPALGYPGAPEAYERLARTIARQEPYVATADQMSSWRSTRRAVRAERIAPDGTVLASVHGDAAQPARAATPLMLEESTGKRRESVQR